MALPTDPQARKNIPLARGLLDYFPDALCAVAELSRIGNEQHNPGEPLHWAKEKSSDEADALLRHLIGRGTLDIDGVRESTKVAWRALALLQREIEAEQALSARDDWDEQVRNAHAGQIPSPDAQRPDENALQHRTRVNRPWNREELAATIAPHFRRQPDDFASEPEPRRESKR